MGLVWGNNAHVHAQREAKVTVDPPHHTHTHREFVIPARDRDFNKVVQLMCVHDGLTSSEHSDVDLKRRLARVSRAL